MKLIEALNLVKNMQRRPGAVLRCGLATGFTALHMKTLLAAELSLIYADRKVEAVDGLYGDLSGNIERLTTNDFELGVVLIEWPDLDPRLGLRNAARWSKDELADILETARSRAGLLQRLIENASTRVPVVLCMPTLPLLPVQFTPGWQTSSFDTELRGIMQSIEAAVAACGQVRIVSSQRLALDSPITGRHDIDAELTSGFPYRMAHAAVLAGLVARLAQKPVPKKGLITDLDNTLWGGIVGEDGIEGISWDLEHHTQMHAFYQRFLGALVTEGVMVGVASKNDPAVVEQALGRRDLAVSPAGLFPVEANWKAKSESVARILSAWNVGADSVVFIDDSPLELEEVKSAYPQIECIQFPTGNSPAVYDLVVRLRDMFGRAAISDEDRIRVDGIRRRHLSIDVHSTDTTDLLERSEAVVDFSFVKSPVDPRALDLVNKTNQFNLNGKRYIESSWNRLLSDPDSFILIASYTDKFGPLGKIAVMTGIRQAQKLFVHSWVMSCRAFSRRIEHKCLAELVGRFDPQEVEFDFLPTERNAPFTEFFTEMIGTSPTPGCIVTRDTLDGRLEKLLCSQEVANG